jgi:hypothetical protein
MQEFSELQATPRQKRMFFALCRELKIDAVDTKEKVKKKYKLDSFANISMSQLGTILDRMTVKAKG